MIGERRRRNLGAGEREEFDRLNLWLEQGMPEEADRLLARLGELAELGDSWDPLRCV